MSDADVEARRRGCCVMANYSAAELPPGWVEIQRDDCPEEHPAHRFDGDEDAARWVSRAARYWHPDRPSFSYSIDGEPEPGAIVIVPELDARDLGLC
ncbi:MAG: hypothetical protein RID81_07060 [Sandaracinaceae bacterium]